VPLPQAPGPGAQVSMFCECLCTHLPCLSFSLLMTA
jgi:hypothetical protein